MSVDLADWRPEYDEAIEAAREFNRRMRKNIPPDRWADGTIGLRKVALGFECYEKLLSAHIAANKVLFDAFRELQLAQMQASAASMGVFDRHGTEKN